ncbi:hypothetical protein GCM10009760_13960 [Kitasatospora kazusensis]|uniref:AAA+ ATPase domain-containing protein n=2 Tax=Kitasatospora kazusensis TaxID=407974 RepID=A0ABP5KPG0_9ACTN
MQRAIRQAVEQIALDAMRNSPDIPEMAREAANETVRGAMPELKKIIHERVVEAHRKAAPVTLSVQLPGRPEVTVERETHRLLPDVLLALGAACHLLLVGPAGTGKSHMAKHAAAALGLSFHALSLGPTTPMSKVFGYLDAEGNYRGTPFRAAYEHGGVMLLDELDNGHPGLLAELNQALAIGCCAFADGMVDAHPEFRLVATANTYGHGGDHQYVGRQALDAATLDRFTVIDIPVDPGLEERLVAAHAPSQLAEALRLLAEVRKLRATAKRKRLPLVFSPRASIDGAKLLEAGATWEQALSWRVTRGLSNAHRQALGLGFANDAAQ